MTLINLGSRLKKHISMRTDQSDIERVRYLEADTVAHRGGSILVILSGC
jgi:hypothetical protein